jgi:hypothetical protein
MPLSSGYGDEVCYCSCFEVVAVLYVEEPEFVCGTFVDNTLNSVVTCLLPCSASLVSLLVISTTKQGVVLLQLERSDTNGIMVRKYL